METPLSKPRDYSGTFAEMISFIPEDCITWNEVNEIAIMIMKFLERIQNKVN